MENFAALLQHYGVSARLDWSMLSGYQGDYDSRRRDR